jgi:hypothetical protein
VRCSLLGGVVQIALLSCHGVLLSLLVHSIVGLACGWRCRCKWGLLVLGRRGHTDGIQGEHVLE